MFSQPSPGSIVIIGFSVDGDDYLSFITLQDIPAGTVIYFTDNEWNESPIGSGGAFVDTNEGFILWTNDSGGTIQEGTVINMSDVKVSTRSANIGSISTAGGFFNPGADNEGIYAYVGTGPTTPTVFLAALVNDEYSSAPITNTGLSDGVTASRMDGDEDVGLFIGTVDCTGDPDLATCAARFNTMDGVDDPDWSTEDGTGDQADDGNAPDFPANFPAEASFTIPGTFGILPVELSAFQAQKALHQINLTWQTITETNNDYIIIERSLDGREFSKIGTVQGAGTTHEVQNYEFTDNAPLSGMNYYRLRQVDFDGTTTYSDIVSVEFGKASEISIFPNPTTADITLTFTKETSRETTVQILSQNGSVAKTEVLAANTLQQNLNVNKLSAGIYFMRVITGNSVETLRFVKK